MPETAFVIVGLLVAALAGAALAWFFARSRIELAELRGKASGDVALAQLTEQVRSLSQEQGPLKERVNTAEARRDTLQLELNRHLAERAQLIERTAAIPNLQEDVQVARQQAEAAKSEARDLNAKLSAESAFVQRATAQLREHEQTIKAAVERRDQLQAELAKGGAELSRVTEELAAERRNSQEKLTTLQQARKELSDQFKTLASEILDEKSRKFTEQNQANLGQLLNPLKDQLTAFKSKVEEVYVNEGKDRSALAEQVRQLMTLNQTLHQDATNLALALKGDRKAQGNWGEIILDDVLERAGLVDGMHYQRQTSIKSEDGISHVIPDVVVRLPGERHLVIDSKLTLPDYRAFADAQSDVDRDAALKRHLLSVRNHIRGLSEKNYQSLYGLKSLDFVVMFVPLEPAFMLAVTNDSELFQQAWEKNVLLVSPSTLLFVVRTVANLWRQEDQSRNAKEISARGAELYEKLVGFVKDLFEVGQRIEQAQSAYHEARKKLSEGRGNVVRQAEMLKELGVKPAKSLPTDLIQSAIESDRAGSISTEPADDSKD